MAPKAQPSPKNSRNLSIIYFFNDKKTRSFKISIHIMWTMILLGVGIITWTVASILFLAHQANYATKIESQLQKTKDALFQFQVQYTNVYAKAYPKRQSLAKKQLSPQASSPTVLQDVLAQLSHDQPLELTISNHEKWPIVLEDILLQPGNDAHIVQLDLSLRNRRQSNLSKGYLWAVITLIDSKTARKHLITSPSKISLNQKGIANNPRSHALKYRLRYHTTKSLEFSRPKNTDLRATNIKIFLMNHLNQQVSYTIPLGQAVESSAPVTVSGKIKEQAPHGTKGKAL